MYDPNKYQQKKFEFQNDENVILFDRATCSINNERTGSDHLLITNKRIVLLKSDTFMYLTFGCLSGLVILVAFIFFFIMFKGEKFVYYTAIFVGASAVGWIRNWSTKPVRQFICKEYNISDVSNFSCGNNDTDNNNVSFTFSDQIVLTVQRPEKVKNELKELQNVFLSSEQESPAEEIVPDQVPHSENEGTEPAAETKMEQTQQDQQASPKKNHYGTIAPWLVLAAAICGLVALLIYDQYRSTKSPDALAWKKVQDKEISAHVYLKEYPNGLYKIQAETMMQEEKTAFENIKKDPYLYNIERFLENYPMSPYKNELEKYLDDPEWALRQTNHKALHVYLQRNTKDTPIRRKIEKRLKERSIQSVVELSNFPSNSKVSFEKQPGNYKVAVLLLQNTTNKTLSFFITDNNNVFKSFNIYSRKQQLLFLTPGEYSFAIVLDDEKDVLESTLHQFDFNNMFATKAYGKQDFKAGLYVLSLQLETKKVKIKYQK